MSSSPQPNSQRGDPNAAGPQTPVEPLVGPVGADRIALVRRRIAVGRYPVDTVALATELLQFWPRTSNNLSREACRFLATAIDKLDPALAMALQLLYCEQLGPAGAAVVLGWQPAQIEAARQAGLMRLAMVLKEEASRLTLPRAASK